MGLHYFKFKSVSIRTKIFLGQVLILALVSVFIYTYYPNQQKKLAVSAINSEIKSISNMFAIGVGIGMGDIDLVAVSEAMNWAQSDSAVVFLSATNINGLEIGSFNTESLEVPASVLKADSSNFIFEQDKVIYYKTAITYQNQQFGKLIIGYSLKNLEASIAKLRKTTLYFCLVLFCAGAAFSIIISNKITRNIRKLDSAVKSISSGIKHTRVNVKSNDEISLLGKAFNEMLDNLERSEYELITYSEQLKKQNNELNQFSYVVSHDLKAPLRAIHKLSEWIEEDLNDNIPEDTKKNLKILRGRVLRMEALINGLLEYSKIGRTDVSQEKVDTRMMVNEIIDLHQPPAHIKINVQQDMPVFNTKKILLLQTLSNLISNAIKYNNKPEGWVNISVKSNSAYYKFSIEDNGMGIKSIYHEKVFTIFQTLHPRDELESTGIGLSIVKKSVEAVGGKVTVESEEGKGATFTFTWPKELKAG